MLGLSLFTLFFGAAVGYFFVLRRPRKRQIKTEKFEDLWLDLQAYLRNKDTWAEALVEADKLLDKALKKKRFRGKSMGERLVSAQRFITDNDDVWDAHNLVKKIVAKNGEVKLRETDVKENLISFKLALIDLGALPGAKSKDN
jgi:hypothetical protein